MNAYDDLLEYNMSKQPIERLVNDYILDLMVDIKCAYRDNSESLPLENYANECERELLRLAFKADHKLSQYGMLL